ncbi:Y+L amino acid transporter 2 [Araneus ventricosus]|uniref:Y+L amino acid transporter 2 n=1 Tax=Araneus ventricosus TaxID=182803 RepID=A0A4Y2LAJ0_ARAVE|nr:Y+L amino acid transporter 2 [Araneus ventricosus]
MQNTQNPDNLNVCVQRKLGLASSISMTLSAIIGAGIFISPKGTLKYSGSVGMSLVIWGLSGLISMIGAMCFIELGTSIPFSGSKYTYLLICFGELPAFLYLWSYIVILAPVFNVVLSLTFANYIIELFFPNCAVPPGAVRLLASLPICLLTYVNCRKVHWATRVQGIFTSTKILALTIIIVAGAYHLYSGNTQNFNDAFHETTKNPSNMVLGFYHGLYAFAGWDFINHVTEELKNPSVNLPRNIYISLSLVTVIYVLANVAYLAVLTPTEILTSNAVAVSFGEKIFGMMFSAIMSLFVVLSTFGTMNCRIYRSSRLFFAAAKEGHLPNLLAMVHVKYLTPVPSIIFAVNLFFPVTYLLVSGFLIIFSLFADLWEPLMGIAVVASGVPIYMVAVIWRNKLNFYDKAFTGKSGKVGTYLIGTHLFEFDSLPKYFKITMIYNEKPSDSHWILGYSRFEFVYPRRSGAKAEETRGSSLP